jgi:hypothetical protein
VRIAHSLEHETHLRRAIGLEYCCTAEAWSLETASPSGHSCESAPDEINLVPMEKMWDNGFMQITTSTKQIESPADLK